MVRFSTTLAGALAAATVMASTPSWADNWIKECDDKGRCSIDAVAIDGAGQQLGLISLRQGENGGMLGELVLPLNLFIPAGAEGEIDASGQRMRADFVTCTPAGCISVFRLNAGFVDGLRAGSLLNLRVVDARSRQPVDMTFSLSGFTAAAAEITN